MARGGGHALRRVLFLCTGNCVRSQMAEALLNYRAAGRIEAVSAGSCPAGFVHPLAIEVLAEIQVPTRGLRSKSWREFAGQDFDAVITLCGEARRSLEDSSQPADVGTEAPESCPVFPVRSRGFLPVRAHWGFADPSQAPIFGREERLEAFRRTRLEIRECVERLATAPDPVLEDDAAFARLVREIGEAAPQR